VGLRQQTAILSHTLLGIPIIGQMQESRL
jgi:hypothetical protein